VDLCPRFLVPFLRSIFAPFLVNSQSRICLFYGTFWPTRVVFDPFLDGFLTVHLVTILPPFTSVELRSIFINQRAAFVLDGEDKLVDDEDYRNRGLS
jgi:hypothetical protein